MYSKNYDVFCVTETWLEGFILNKRLYPQTIRFIERIVHGHRGGGIITAVKTASKLISKHSNVVVITIELQTSPQINIIGMYVPPNCDGCSQSNILNVLSMLPRDNETILLGDLNLPDANWATFTANTPFSQDIVNTIHNSNYLQIVTTPTHLGGNILDVIVTNSPQRFVLTKKNHYNPTTFQ